MNGSAPNCSAIGSQMLVNKKCQPNLCRASMELVHSSYTSRLVTSTTEAAKHSVSTCVISSPLRSRRKNARGPAKGPAARTTWEDAAMLLNLGDGLHLLFDDFFREFCIRKRLGEFLAVAQHPLQKSLQGVPLRSVRDLCGDQQPGKARNRIGGLSVGVSDGNTKIIRHVLRRGSRSRADSGKVRLYEVPGGVSDTPVGHVVLDGEDQLDIADGIRRLLDQARHAFVAFSAESHRPVHRGSFSDLGFPGTADLRKIVGPDVSRPATIGAVNHNDIVGGKVDA